MTEHLDYVEAQIEQQRHQLEALREERKKSREPVRPSNQVSLLLSTAGIKQQKYRLVAQGDSWFDYLPGHDLIDYLEGKYGHEIENIGVAGSTLNDIAYGSVPKDFFGIPCSDELLRISQLIHAVEQVRPQAVLLSGGGNDIAGEEFFPLLNNALSKLDNPNALVLNGVMKETLQKGYRDTIDTLLAKAKKMGVCLPIFIHGYDYPWPDGRAVFAFNIIGPWFHQAFNKKNFPFEKQHQEQLLTRFLIMSKVIDAFNEMLAELAMAVYPGKVFHVDLRGTLKTRDRWANELHPNNDGFEDLAERFNFVLHQVLR